ncbi:hypothetical protein Tco_0011341 [Tanacetum coccineum]
MCGNKCRFIKLVKTGLFKAIDSSIPLDEHLATFRGNGYSTKGQKSSQNDKTEHEMLYRYFSQDTISVPITPLPIPAVATQDSQDRLSQDKHIELVNIIGNPGAGMLTRAMAKQLSAASAHECLFVDFLFEEEPKKVSEALKHPG